MGKREWIQEKAFQVYGTFAGDSPEESEAERDKPLQMKNWSVLNLYYFLFLLINQKALFLFHSFKFRGLMGWMTNIQYPSIDRNDP